MSRFLRPDTNILKISNGDTLIVRRRLTAGEQRAHFARMYVAGLDGRLHVNPLQVGLAQMVAYLLDWSLTDDDGRVVAIRDQPPAVIEGALDALDTESFAEIRIAIEAHIAAMDAEREQEKNGSAGESKSPATSPSLAVAGGGTSGSVN